MKNILILIVLLITTTLSAQTLSFDEALLKLSTDNKKLKGMQKHQKSKEFAAKSTKGLFFPELTLNGSYVYLSDDLSLDFNGYKPKATGLMKKYSGILVQSGQGAILQKIGPAAKKLFAKDWKYTFQDQEITRLSVDLKYPLYTGGKIRTGVKVKKLEVEVAKAETEKTKGLLIAELTERYFQTQLAFEGIKVRQQSLESSKKHLYNAEKMEENGMLAPVQKMLANTSVSDNERALLGAKKDAELAQTALQGLLGGKVGYTDLSTPLFKIKGLNTLKHYQELAQKNYPDIIKAEVQKELTLQNIKYQKSNYIPDVALIAKKYIYTKNLPMTEPDNWYVGMGLKMDLFKGFQNRRKYQEAIAMNESVELLIEQAKIDIQTLVKKYYTEILKQQEQLESLEKSTEFAEELVRVREKAFKASFATSTDVSDANLYLASIKIKRLKALYEMDKSLAKLLEICGASNTFTNYITL